MQVNPCWIVPSAVVPSYEPAFALSNKSMRAWRSGGRSTSVNSSVSAIRKPLSVSLLTGPRGRGRRGQRW